jgi:hypothetical protein
MVGLSAFIFAFHEMVNDSSTNKLLFHSISCFLRSSDVLFLVYAFSCDEDLAVYVKALEDHLLRIPANSLSKV